MENNVIVKDLEFWFIGNPILNFKLLLEPTHNENSYELGGLIRSYIFETYFHEDRDNDAVHYDSLEWFFGNEIFNSTNKFDFEI